MAEKDTIFSSKVKYRGVFSYTDFYKFCYDWIKEEIGLSNLAELVYSEKISGDMKSVDIEWKGSRKFTDYFKFEMVTKFKIIAMKKIEINRGGQKIKTNEGEVGISVTGTLVRDYQNKFETSATMKMYRAVYEKWIVASRIDQFENKISGYCDEFLSQAKAYLDLEGKR